MSEESTNDFIIDAYRERVEAKHPGRSVAWPLLTGYNVKIGKVGDWLVHVFQHSGVSGYISSEGLGELDASIVRTAISEPSDLSFARANISKHFRTRAEDAVVFLHTKPDGNGRMAVKLVQTELDRLILQHETFMGLSPMRIFLSHKSSDKSVLRDFSKTLALLGFEPWLDEDAMVAGTNLERGLLNGFEESCGVVFFITDNFVDENYLATEIDYAMQQKRAKGEKFAIITLCFNAGASRVVVPPLLKTFVFKEPATHLEALREIVKALPIKVGDVLWR